MNNGVFGEGFPYSNFHDLNLDWIISIIKDFKDRYPDVISELENKLNKPVELGRQGDLLVNDGDNVNTWKNVSEILSPQMQEYVNTWLDEHPEATTTVQDNSLTEEKFTEPLRLKTLKDYLTPQMYGAVADGETDDKDAIVACFAKAVELNKPVYFPEVAEGYYISDVITVTDSFNIIMDSPIISNGSALIIGSDNARIADADYKIMVMGDGTGTGTKFINIYNSRIYFEGENYTNGVIFEGTNGNGFVYNLITLGKIFDCEYCVTLNSNDGWCNENLFLNGRLGHYSSSSITTTGVLITSETDYYSNNNIFIKPCVENCENGFKIEYGTRNSIIFCRTENTQLPFYFAEGTRDTLVFVTFGSPLSEDHGLNNIVVNFDTTPQITYNVKLYDSGCISDYAFTAGNNINSIGNYLCRPSNNTGTIATPRITKYIGYVTFDRVLGVMIDTTYCKRFRVSPTTKENDPVRYAVKMFDTNGDEITTGITTGYAHGGKLNYSENGVSTGVGAFITGSDSTTELLFEVPEGCKKAFIGLKGTGTPFRLEQLSIYGTQRAYVYPSGLSLCLPNMPTCPANEGDIVQESASTNTGWKYYNGEWHTF